MRIGRTLLVLATGLCLLCTPLRAQINTDRMMSVGRNALHFEDYVLSIQYFNQVISAKPYLAEPYFYRAIAKLYLEDYLGAEEDCSQSISRNRFDVNCYEVRGLARVFQKKYEEAISDFRTGLDLDPENTSLRHNLIYSLINLDRKDEAMAQTDSLIALSPKYAPALSMRSEMLWDRGDSVEALEWATKALELSRYDIGLLQHRGVMLARMERFEEAEADLDRAVSLNPSDAGSYVTRAMIRYFRSNLNGALSDYDLSLMIDPVNVTALYNRGNLRAQVGDDNRAIEDFDKVIEAEPDNYHAIYYRGLLRNETGDLTGAEQDMTRILDEYPNFIPGYQIRSQVRERLGDSKGAQEDALTVLRYNNRSFNKAMGYEDGQDEDKTRDRSDNNVRNYRKILVDENLENATGYSSELRGRVQNRNVRVEYMDPYRLTYFRDNSRKVQSVHTSRQVDELWQNGCFMSELFMVNYEVRLSQKEINNLFSDIDVRTSKLTMNVNRPDCPLFARAIDFALLQDFVNAESDLNNAIAFSPDNWALWFFRSQVRARAFEARREEVDFDATSKDSETRANEPGYQLAIRDLTQVIELEPSFAFAYYNRGTYYARCNDLQAALEDLNKAVELDESLAEAWYNRGLVLILLDRTDEAARDMSKAGELGIYSSYNIIKRFSKGD